MGWQTGHRGRDSHLCVSLDEEEQVAPSGLSEPITMGSVTFAVSIFPN